MRYWYILLVPLFITACRSEAPDAEITEETNTDFAYDLVVRRPSEPLLAAPGPDGQVVTSLPAGTRLKDLAVVSPFTGRLEEQGAYYHEPWIKVETESGRIGWVYARISHFLPTAGVDTLDWTHKKRLLAYLGPEWLDSLTAYRVDFQQINTLDDMARTYRRGTRLRDHLIRIFEDKLDLADLPDLFWLSEVMPGFLPQLVAEGTAYYLFVDYRQWLPPARRTPNPADDRFLDLCLYLFPQDSVEYFFPVWKLQTWDYGGHSLLGRGYHLNVLRLLEALPPEAMLFEQDLRKWREALIDDITDPEATYWEEQAVVVAEFDRILAGDFRRLTKQDKVALEVRRRQMEDANKYGIEFNHQSGLY